MNDLYYLPATGEDVDLIELALEALPGLTHKLNIEQARVNGMTDGADALTQAIYFILNIERYRYPIYSQRYGSELADLIGAPKDYAAAELKRRITEALIQDDRIEGVDSWEFSFGKNTVTTTFTVHTVYGEIQIDEVFDI